MKHVIATYGLALWILCVPAWAASSQALPASEDGQYGFAGSLFEEGDYYRAIGEYKRLLFLSPKSARRDEVRYMIGICYLRGKRATEAVHAFEALAVSDAPGPWKEKADVKIGEALYSGGDDERAIAHWSDFLQRYPRSGHVPRVLYMSGWAEARRCRFRDAKERFHAAATASGAPGDLKDSALRAAEKISSSLPLPTRSSWVSGAASALVPGLGQFYCGRTGDAVSAFVVTGGCGWLTLDALQREDRSMAVFWGVLTGIFYSGNIYGGVDSARQFDRKAERDLGAELERSKLLSIEEAF